MIQIKNLTISITFKDLDDVNRILLAIKSEISQGQDTNQINYKTASGFYRLEFPTNYNFQDRFINGLWCRTYKSEI